MGVGAAAECTAKVAPVFLHPRGDSQIGSSSSFVSLKVASSREGNRLNTGVSIGNWLKDSLDLAGASFPEVKGSSLTRLSAHNLRNQARKLQ